MDSEDQDTSGTTGEGSAHSGHAEDRVVEYHVHEHTTIVSQLGKDPECREALDRLYHYLDGELTESRRLQIKEHLDTCMPCLEAFDFEAELKILIASRCRDDVPVHLRMRVIEALAEASLGGVADEAPAGKEGASGPGGESDDERTDRRGRLGAGN
jgi:mycothiol system anti-sigma-R factor